LPELRRKGQVTELVPPSPSDGTGGLIRCRLERGELPVGRTLALQVALTAISGVEVPRGALVHRADGDEVVLIRRRLLNGDAELERRRVVVDEELGDAAQAVVTHGLEDGARVVTSRPDWLAEQI
jgi:hypothetical protein